MDYKQALEMGLTIVKPRLKTDRYEDAVGKTPKEKAIWVLLKLRWKEREIASAVNVCQQYISKKKIQFGL